MSASLDRVRARVAEIERGFAAMRAARPTVAFRDVLRAASQRWSAPSNTRFDAAIARAAEAAGIEASLLKAVVAAESGFNPNAVSPAGARGLTQLMPGTAAALGVGDPFDPESNLFGGARYLRQQLDRFGSLPLALAAYNAGPANVTRYGGIPPFAETQRYVGTVMGLLDAYRERD